MSFGVSSAGFLKPTPDEIEAKLTVEFRTQFGSDVTLTPQTFLGQELQIKKKREIEFWDALESVYFSLFIATATGSALDNVAFPFIRDGEKISSTVLTFTGINLSTIPLNSLAQSADGTQFSTIEIGAIAGTTTNIPAICLTAGLSGNFPVGSITTLPVTITGISAVTNNTAATGGAAIENDADFISRIRLEALTSKSSSVAAIRKAVLAITGVTQCNVEENKTDIDDPDTGIPSHSIQVVVTGSATDEDVATAIFNAKPAGIGTFGAETFTVTDSSEDYVINFDRSTTVNVFVDIIVTIDGAWRSENAETIKHRVLAYIGGVDENDNNFPGLLSGVDVLIWKTSAALFDLANENEDLGITDVQVELSRTSDPSSSETGNLIMGASEKAITDLSFITVTTI